MRLVTLLFVGALLASVPPAQQLVLAQNDDLSYSNNAVGWPASVIGFRFTAPTTMIVDAAQVFTGNASPAIQSVEIRTRDATTGLPDQLVGQPGTWQLVHARCWQGARLAVPAVLTGNTDYFLVWRVQGMFPQHSTAAAGNPGSAMSEIRIGDGSSWFSQTTGPAKFRLYMPYPAGTIGAFGSAKPGSFGSPVIGLSGWPAVGSPIDIWLDDAARAQPALLLIGWPIPGGIPHPLGDIYVADVGVSFQLTWTHTSPFVGAVSRSFVVPNAPALSGLTIAFQFGIADPGAAGGIAHTGAVTATLQ